MALKFSNSPYWDDYDVNKNFHKILFKPGYAVQARELTQSQTILQNQITKFGDHIFKNNSIVSGAKCTVNLNVNYLKLNELDINGIEINSVDFLDKMITNSTGTILAKVLYFSEKKVNSRGIAIDPPTLIVSYISGEKFSHSDAVYVIDSTIIASVIPTSSVFYDANGATGKSSIASITDGVLYVNGMFVSVQNQTIDIFEYSNTPSARIGLAINESIVSVDDDPSLLDPALGSSNFQAPGADRYKILLSLSVKTLELDSDENFIELIRIKNGQILKSVVNTDYSIIDDYFARRTFDTNGDFVTDKFKITTETNSSANDTFKIVVGPGKAYVRGYIVENQSPLELTSNKARDSFAVSNKDIYMNYGNFLYCNNITGFVDHKMYPNVDIHIVKTANTVNSLTYSTTIAATGRIRGFDFQFADDPADSKSFIYKIFLMDIQGKTLTANAIAVTSNTIQLPDYFSYDDNAYNGVYLKINSGVNVSDVNQIVSYNGTSKVATLTKDFLRLPENDCNFSLLFGSKDFESIYNSIQANTHAWVDTSSKIGGVDSGDTIFSNVGDQELLFNYGQNFIVKDSIENSKYYSWLRFKNIQINSQISVSGSQIMKFIGGSDNNPMYQSAINENFVCVIDAPGNSGLLKGDIVAFDGTSSSGIILSSDQSIATLIYDGWVGVYVDIYAKVSVENANDVSYVLKQKTLISSNVRSVIVPTTQLKANVYMDLTNAQILFANNSFNVPKQSLYISDVKEILKIIDTKSIKVFPTAEIIADPQYDVTRYYTFDNGQRDNYYDHGSISLIPGAPAPVGNILVVMSYYDHSGGDGFFTVDSYINESYEKIPTYSSTSGRLYYLRDVVDFRPRIKNNQTDFVIDYTISNPIGIPIDGTSFTTDYAFYLGRKDIVVISKDNNVLLVEGVSSIFPQEPREPDGSLVIARISHEPYTSILPGATLFGGNSSLNVKYVSHKRWRMKDITTLEDRVNRLEYYTALNNLEESAKNIQIPDEFGINRFKNGILTDDFSTYEVSDTTNLDYSCSISQLNRKLTALNNVTNLDLKLKDVLYTLGRPSQDTLAKLNYAIHTDGASNYVSLPFTKVEAAVQPLASRIVNVNPFMFVNTEGQCGLNPSIDNWISTERLPDLLIVNPNTQLYLQSDTVNLLADWQTFTSTEKVETRSEQQLFKVPSGSSTGTGTSPYQMTEKEVINFMNLYGSEPYYYGQLLSVAITKPLVSPLGYTYMTSLKNAIQVFLYEKYKKTGVWAGVGSGTANITTTTYDSTLTKQKVWGNWESLGSSYETVNGFVTDVSLNPYIRGQQIEFYARNLLINDTVGCFFDGIDVTDLVRQANVIEIERQVAGRKSAVTGITTWEDEQDYPLIYSGNDGRFDVGDIIGCYNTNKTPGHIRFMYDPDLVPEPTFLPVAKVIDITPVSRVESLVDATESSFTLKAVIKEKLSLVWDIDSPTYTDDYLAGKNLFSLTFDEEGEFSGIKAKANSVSIIRNSGKIFRQIDSNTITIPRFFKGEFANNTSNFVGRFVNQITDQYSTRFLITGGYELDVDDEIVLFCNNDILMANSMAGTIYDIKSNTEGKLKTDNTGSVTGVFYLPANAFNTGQRVFRVDNRIGNNPGTETNSAQAIFFASSLNVQKQNLNFAPDIASVKNTFSRTDISTVNRVTEVSKITSGSIANYHDPLCQSFIFYKDEYPNGLFIKSFKIFFKRKPLNHNIPITVSILGTLNGYPNGETLSHSVVTLNTDKVKVSDNPSIDDPSSWTLFEMPVPVYIKPETMYALMIWTNTNEYEVYTARLGDIDINSGMKIGSTPYIGNLFLSQNAITWTADQNQSIMFVAERCEFNISTQGIVEFTVPKKLPQRALVDNSLAGFADAKYLTQAGASYTRDTDILVDAFNVTTTDLTFDVCPIFYSYRSTTASSKTIDLFPTSITPGRYGTATYDNIYLDDGRGERILLANSDNSFVLTAQLLSADSALSPIISEDGVTLYAVNWRTNNLEMSNNNISIIEGGSGYSSSPLIELIRTDGNNGSNAILKANVGANGSIVSVEVVGNGGTGYLSTPTITISDGPSRGGNANAVIIVSGETSNYGGQGKLKYISKPVLLAPEFDAGDLRVYYTAYRPLNSDINIYYKILNRNDMQMLHDGNWQLMTTTSGAFTYSTSRSEIYEYVAAPGINNIANNKVSYTSSVSGQEYNTFYQFAIKVVISTSDPTMVPFLTDIRAIALTEMI